MNENLDASAVQKNMNAKIEVKLLVFTLIQFNLIQLFNTVNNLIGVV